MAIIKCRECGKEYSDKAKSCPNCACPTRYNIRMEMEEPDGEEEDIFSEIKESELEDEESEYLEIVRMPRKPSIIIPVLMTLAAIACVAFAVLNYTVIMKDRNPVLMLILLIAAAAVLVVISIAFYLRRMKKYNRMIDEMESQMKEETTRPRHAR